MKWIFLNPIKVGGWGGMENWMLNLSGGLVRLGDECLIVGRAESRWPAACKERGIAFSPLRFAFDLAPWTLAQLHLICRRFRPDVGIVKGFRQCRFLRLSWPSAAIGCKLPSAIELTDSFADRWTYRTCLDRVLVDNHVARHAFLHLPWVLPDKIVTVHNGVRPFSPDEKPRRRAILLSSLNIGEDCLIVAAAGRLSPEKRFADALHAFAGASQATDARLVLFGDGPEKTALAELASRLGIAGKVVFAGWKEDLRDVLPGADVLIHTSAVEGLPNVVLEAMSGGVAVVATDAGGTREIIASPDVGSLVPCGDIPALTQRLGELISDHTRRKGVGEFAAAHVRRHFTLDSMAADVRTAMRAAWTSKQALRAAPHPTGGKMRWVRTPDAPFDAEALAWTSDPSADRISTNRKSSVMRMERPEGTFYIKTFHRAGLRTPAGLRNFRLAHLLSLRGATVVPHLAAAWQRDSARMKSLLFTGTIPFAIPLDRYMNDIAPSPPRRAVFAAALAQWLAHLHAAGVGAHDLKATNILVRELSGPGFAFILLDLDNGKVWSGTVPDRVAARNFHQLFRSFQNLLRPKDTQRFAAAYRRCRQMDHSRFRRILSVAEQRLHRRGTGYAELRRPDERRLTPVAPVP